MLTSFIEWLQAKEAAEGGIRSAYGYGTRGAGRKPPRTSAPAAGGEEDKGSPEPAKSKKPTSGLKYPYFNRGSRQGR